MITTDARPPRKKSHQLFNRHTVLCWRIILITSMITRADAAALINATLSETSTQDHQMPEDTTKYAHESLIQSTLYVDEPATVTAVSNYLDDEITSSYDEFDGQISYNLIDSHENTIDDSPLYISEEDDNKFYSKYAKETKSQVSSDVPRQNFVKRNKTIAETTTTILPEIESTTDFKTTTEAEPTTQNEFTTLKEYTTTEYRFAKESEITTESPYTTENIRTTELGYYGSKGDDYYTTEYNPTTVDSKQTTTDSEPTTTEIDQTTMETTTIDDDYHADENDEEESVAINYNMTEPTIDMGPLNAFRDIATSFVESLVDRIVPQSFRDIWRRMQNQNEQLEMIRLRSREENGGLGQFGRNLLKGLATPINQWMQGVRDYGSLDSDRNFLAGVASGVATVADSLTESFQDRVRAIYPGTLWCGDGHIGKSSDIGLFFMTDNCCKKHDSCKMYIMSGETKYGLTNTGIFSRTHCECDKAFYKCLKKTNSLISNQVGVTFFSILGPQCFKKEHPIVKCVKRTRITGQKCEEYALDYSQPKMWQWFDNDTF